MTSSSDLQMILVFLLGCTVVMSGNPNLADRNLRLLSEASNRLALNIHQEIVRRKPINVFFSPIGIMNVLAMLLLGARGETNRDIRTVLHLDSQSLSNDQVHKTFKHLQSYVYPKDISYGYEMKYASSMLVEKSVPLYENFRDEIQKFYNTSIHSVDFQNKAPEIKNKVNEWVEEHTNGKIKDFLDYVRPDSMILLLNAIYFKGMWKLPFNPSETTKMTFFNYNQDTEPKQVEVDMMHVSESFLHSVTNEYEAIFIPYNGNRTEMLILVPNDEKNLPDFVESLTSAKLHRIIAETHEKTELDLYLPKFKFEFNKSLVNHLIFLGLNAFSDSTFNFEGMTDEVGVPLNDIIHKTYIEVTEEGTEAAAVTSTTQTISDKIDCIVNKPFVFLIMDRKRELILFMGQVAEL